MSIFYFNKNNYYKFNHKESIMRYDKNQSWNRTEEVFSKLNVDMHDYLSKLYNYSYELFPMLKSYILKILQSTKSFLIEWSAAHLRSSLI